jgi:hypothetical protein
MKTYAQKYNTPEYRKKYTGIYGSWYAMKQRCRNKNNKQFKDYGGRGITYDPRWESFAAFEKDMSEGYERGLTIDRIDNNGNYCKENCRWATRTTQCRNKRDNRLITYQGMSLTLPEWSEYIGLSSGTIRSRFYRGMTVEETLNPHLFRPAKLST